MALSIKHPDADRLARALAARTGLSLTDAILLALREQLNRTASPQGTSLADELMALGQRCASLPVLDPRSPDALLGYDDSGLPR
jgi:antitoxin VapB